MGSYIHDANQIFFTGTFGHDVKNQRAQQYSIEIAALDIKDQLITWAERNFSYTGFQVRQNGNGKMEPARKIGHALKSENANQY